MERTLRWKADISRFFCLIAILATVGCATYRPAEFSRRDYILHGVMTAAMAADYLQTIEISDNDDFYEKNEILGRNPSKKEVSLYFGALWLLNTGVVYLLPSGIRPVYQVGATAIHTVSVIDNHSIGVRINF